MIYQETLADGLAHNLTLEEATRRALQTALRDATGEGSCNVNLHASAWFWFTVMTTVGYGNQSLSTQAGRTMVYTLGFVSILLFGAVLWMAGHIVAVIVDDGLRKWPWWTTPWAGCLLWGSIYYAWSLLIAATIQAWKIKYLRVDFSFAEGYWFAFISTTTVGFGDVYLEPEVIVGGDLLVFPLLLLFGFVYLSAFLGKLADWHKALVGENKDSIVGSVLQQLQPPKEATSDDSSAEPDT